MNPSLLRAAPRLALVLGLLLALLWWADPAQVGARLTQAEPRWLALALACSVAANVASALRWRALARWLGAAVSARWALRTYFQGVALNVLLPGAVVGGDLYRIHALARTTLPLPESALTVLADRVGGLWLLVALGLCAAAWGLSSGGLPGAPGRPALPAWLPLALAALMVAVPLALLRRCRRGATAPTGRWQRLARRPEAAAQYGRQVLWSVTVQLLSIGALAAGGAAIGLQLPAWAYAVGAVPTFLMAALPVGFGGWGTREAAAALAFSAFGVAPPQAVGLALLYGTWALGQGLVGAALWLRGGAAPARRG